MRSHAIGIAQFMSISVQLTGRLAGHGERPRGCLAPLVDAKRPAAHWLIHGGIRVDARDHHTASDSDMLVGMPAIAGTRLAVRSIIERFEDVDFVDQQQEDCTEITLEAFMAVELHAKTRLPKAGAWADHGRGRPETLP